MRVFQLNGRKLAGVLLLFHETVLGLLYGNEAMNNFRLLLCIAGMITYLVLWHLLNHPAQTPLPARPQPARSITDGDKLDLLREQDQTS